MGFLFVNNNTSAFKEKCTIFLRRMNSKTVTPYSRINLDPISYAEFSRTPICINVIALQ